MSNRASDNLNSLHDIKIEIDGVFNLADKDLLEKEKIEAVERKVKNILDSAVNEMNIEELRLKLKKLNSGWTNELKSGFHNRQTAENRLGKWRDLLAEVINANQIITPDVSDNINDNSIDNVNQFSDGDILGSNGFGDNDEIDTSQIALCREWIKNWVTEQKKINESKGSYSLKHLVEKDKGQYISNGAFIKAAINLGFEYKREGKNAYFNMSFIKLNNKERQNSKKNKNDFIKIEHTSVGTPKRIGDNIEPVIGAKELSEEVSKILVDMNDNKGSIFGIFGKWGRGKTFLMNLICKEAIIQDNFCIVNFHAWKYQNTPASWAFLYEQIAEGYFDSKICFCFKKDGAFQKYFNIIKLLRPIVRLIRILRLNIYRLGTWSFVCSVFSFVASVFIVRLLDSYSWSPFTNYNDVFFVLLATLSPYLLDIIANLKKFSSKYLNRKSFNNLLGSQAEIENEIINIMKVWPRGNKRILLVVDDVDRCPEEKLMEIVDSLRVMLENEIVHKKIAVLISADERIIKRAIKHKYLKLFGEMQDKKGGFDMDDIMKEYMDKLFLCGIKLGDLTSSEKTDIVYAITKKMIIEDDKVGNSFFDENKTDIENIDNKKDIKSDNMIKKVNKNQITIEEGNELIDAVGSVDWITPRQIDIFIFRYLLARNILVTRGVKYDTVSLCGTIAEHMNNKKGAINEGQMVSKEVERVLEMVIVC